VLDEPYPAENSMRSKVIGIGLNKTGTSSLAVCLRQLGYDHLSCRSDLLALYRQGRLDEVFEVMDRHDSFEDWPYPLMYRELAERYPDASFILTLRKSPEKWLRSLKRHSLHTHPRQHCRSLAYGYPYPHGAEGEHLEIYRRHNQDVVEFFRARGEQNRLLEVCWESGDGWEELCGFLGCEAPEAPFPHANASDARSSSTRNALINRAQIGAWRLRRMLPHRSARTYQ
jgi:hypothetical protein